MSENNTTLFRHNATTVETDTTTFGILYLVVCLPVIVGNVIVMVVVATSRELHLPTLWNMAFMALCDFCYGLHYLVFAVPSALMNQFPYPEAHIASASRLLMLLYGQNVLNIVVATVERYLYILWPLKYSQLMSAKRFTIAVVITVAINISRLGLMVGQNDDVYRNVDFAISTSTIHTLLCGLASVGLPAIAVLVIITFLSRIMLEMVRSRRRVYPLGRPAVSRQFTVTITLSAGLFCLSYLPTCINIVWHLKVGIANIPLMFIKFSNLCLLSNSLWNVVIYAAVYKPFRDAFLRLFCKDYYRRRRQIEVHIIARNDIMQKARPVNRNAITIESCD